MLAFSLAAAAQAQVTMTRGARLAVAATADGRVAFDLRGDLWVVPIGGGEARQLTQDLKSAQRPRWSPNGERLVYSAVADRRRGIWIYDFASGETHNLSTYSNLDISEWGPDFVLV